MLETSKVKSLILEVVDPETNESFSVAGSVNEKSKYFSISKITSRINNMDYLTVLESTCSSSTDIRVFRELMEAADVNNLFVITNVTKKSKQLGNSRTKLNNILKSLADQDFVRKDQGTFFVNPFVFVGKRVRSNEQREALQLSWTSGSGLQGDN